MSNENKQNDERAECAHDYMRTDGVCTECGGSATITCSSKHCPQAAQNGERAATSYDPYDPGNWRDGNDAMGDAKAMQARATQQATTGDERAACKFAGAPKACYRVRCQLGNKCVDDDMSPLATTPSPVAGSAVQAPDVCEICKQPWSAHEMGVPAPYCPDVNDKD